MAKSDRPACIVHWTEIERPDQRHYQGDDELLCIGAAFGRHFGFKALGIHHERLLPGRRTSYPHAESAEEEFVYVIEGTPDVWLDGELHRLKPGDGILIDSQLPHRAENAGRGQAHVLMTVARPAESSNVPDWWHLATSTEKEKARP